MSRAGRVGRVLLASGAVLLVLLLAAILLLPRIARPLLERTLAVALGAPVSIGTLSWEPRNGVVTAEQVAIGEPPDLLRAGRVLLQGDLQALWRGELVFERLEVDAPAGTVELDEHYRLRLGDAAAGDAARPPPITLRRVAVADGDITVRYPVQNELRDAQLHIAHLDASDVTAAGGDADLRGELSGTLDGAPLEMSGRLRMSGAALDFEATGGVSGLDVNRRTINLIPALDTFHATVDLRATIIMVSTPPRQQVQLDVTLHEPRITDDAGTEFAAATVVLPDVRIDLISGAIALDRIAIDDPAGALQLDAQFRPTLARFGRTSSAAASGPQPPVSIRELVITDGELALRYPVGGQLRSAPLHLTRLICNDIELREGRVALRATLDGTLDGAPLQLTAQLTPAAPPHGDAAPELDATLTLSDFTLDRSRVDLPAGFETLRTRLRLGATIVMRNQPMQRKVALDLRLADTTLKRDGIDAAATTVALPAVAIDLVQRHVDLGTVTLEAAKLEADLQSLLAPAAAADSPSSWTVGSAAIDARNARLRLRRGDTTLPMSIGTLTWGGLTPGTAQPLALRAGFDGGATFTLAGSLGLQPLDAGLDLRASGLPLPALARLLDALPLRLTRGSGDATLRVELHGDQRRVAGTARVAELHTAPPDARRPAEVLAVNRADATLTYDSSATPPLDIAALTLSYPYVMVQRRSDGTFPYTLFTRDTAEASGAPRALARVREMHVEGGKLEFIDTLLEPDFWTSFSHMSAEANELRLPLAPGGRFTLAAKRDEISSVEISGAVTDAGLQARATLQDAMLSSFNPYVAPLLGFDVTAGWLSLVLQATPAGSQYDATAKLVLRGVEVSQVGEDAIQRQSGVPLPIALGLIADASGTIDLTLPLAIDTGSGRVTLGSIVGQAVRSAIVGALTSPLRILGSLFGKKGAPHAFAIDPIPFPAGVGALDAAGAARVAEIARILQAHPGLALVAMPQLSASEVGTLGARDAQALADARLAAVRAAFTGADAASPLAATRFMPVAWKPPAETSPQTPPGVYVELQDQP
jgi:hypothetical protein